MSRVLRPLPSGLLAALALQIGMPAAASADALVLPPPVFQSAQLRYAPPTPPGGYLAPAELQVAPPATSDPAKRPTEWVGVSAVPESDRASLYAALAPLAGGLVHVVFRDGASVKVALEGCATTGIVTQNSQAQRIIYEYASIEWIRATR